MRKYDDGPNIGLTMKPLCINWKQELIAINQMAKSVERIMCKADKVAARIQKIVDGIEIDWDREQITIPAEYHDVLAKYLNSQGFWLVDEYDDLSTFALEEGHEPDESGYDSVDEIDDSISWDGDWNEVDVVTGNHRPY